MEETTRLDKNSRTTESSSRSARDDRDGSLSIILFPATTEHSPSHPSAAAVSVESAAGTSASDPPRIAPPPVAAGLDDYAEIFGDFPGSSDIPFFDLPPALDGLGAAPVRPRGSGPDYFEVFGGGADESTASSNEELLAAPGREEVCSWNDRNTEAANCSHQTMEEIKLSPTRSHENHIASEEGGRLSLNSNSSENSFTQFSVSYSRTNQGIKEAAISTETHVTQFHAVPALSFVVGTDTPLQSTESTDSNYMLSDGIGNVKHENKSPSTFSSSSKSSEKYQRAYQDHTINTYPSKKDNVNAHSSSSSALSGDVSSYDINYMTGGISLHTQPVTKPPPLRPPPRLSDKQGHPKPRIFSSTNQDEVDFSSAAAASVAAVEEAMEFAQAKLKIAKEELEKKHDNLLKSKMLGYQKGIKDKERKVSQTSPEPEGFGVVLVTSQKRSEVTTPAKSYKEKEEDVVRSEEEGLTRQDEAKT